MLPDHTRIRIIIKQKKRNIRHKSEVEKKKGTFGGGTKSHSSSSKAGVKVEVIKRLVGPD